MKIGIIGAGNIGGALARILAQQGHDVRLANSRGVEGVREVAEQVGATPVDAKDALEGADVIVLSIPQPAVAALPDDMFSNVPQDVPVIDTGNYYPGLRDPEIAALEAGQAESEWVAEQIGHPVIKAFNNILAYSLAEQGRAAGEPGRLGITVAGADGPAKQRVMELVDTVGFDPVDGGTLAQSWRQQPGTPGYCCDYDAETLRRALEVAEPGTAPARRDEITRTLTAPGQAVGFADILALNRSFNAVP
ncbi:3-hydroxyisobutyrate dehydrogenase [Nocardioides sp. AX2bis]|nr:3-hydroxyisobutyrate dehydrogenase [Nocardioides sp. AX2bis]